MSGTKIKGKTRRWEKQTSPKAKLGFNELVWLQQGKAESECLIAPQTRVSKQGCLTPIQGYFTYISFPFVQVHRILAQDTTYFQIVCGVAAFYSPLRPCSRRMEIAWNNIWTRKWEALPLLFKLNVGNCSNILCQTLFSEVKQACRCSVGAGRCCISPE